MSRTEHWLSVIPAPRPRPEPPPFEEDPIQWDVFISYRSGDRHWAMALYDQLIEAKFKVFLDQFVLTPGLELAHSLVSHLESSASGVLILSKHTQDSKWVEDERGLMRRLKEQRKKTALPFHYVIARIDKTKPEFQDQGDIFADFSEHCEDGPRGGELVKLVHGLVGTSVSETAVRAIQDESEKIDAVLRELAAAAIAGQVPHIVELATKHAGASPLIPIKAASSLISAREEEGALSVVEAAGEYFPRSIRLRQLEGLALRRLKKIDEAQRVLAKLYVDGHRDPETMGIFAATFMQRYETTREPADLERSRALYLDAFAIEPDNEYVGINAAAKSAFLGDVQQAREIAVKVGKLTSKYNDGTDYYKSATLGEALLIVGKYSEAAGLFRKTRERNSHRKGDLKGTLEQVEALIGALGVPQEPAAELRQALKSA